MSHQLAELMGGSLSYVYEDGSVFRFTLPTSDTQNGSELRSGARTALS